VRFDSDARWHSTLDLSHKSAPPQVTANQILHRRLIVGKQVIHAALVAKLLSAADEGV
jgi:hypothetical protein